jgi:hypothetical protein
LYGSDGAGGFSPVAVTRDGQLDINLPSARLPFGSIHTESLTPVFQADGVYGVNQFFNLTTTGLTTGAADAVNTIFNDPEITLQPGEQLTVAVRSTQSAAVCFACLNTREDQ